ncbi:hypothetical protein [Rhizobium sp. LjRoot254]|uniref:hypothetical protein n=1 Tax=Rhizobium sp. LjRoot254 TaxID=3342297 RepID=UPI003ED0D5A5
MSGLQISDRLRQQLASRPCRNEALMRDFETGAAITHRARQTPPSIVAKMAAAFTKPRMRRQIDVTQERQRRRKWGGSSIMPHDLRHFYTEGERAVLGVIAEQVKRKGFCDLCLDKIAEMSGVRRTTVQNAIRKARSGERAHISVQLRPRSGQKNLTNIIRIISSAWMRWLKRSIGFKSLNPSERLIESSLSEGVARFKKAPAKEQAEPWRFNMQSLPVAVGGGFENTLTLPRC